MTITPELLRTWSERICTTTADDVREVAAALGLGGQVVDRGGDAVELEPPPPGAKQLELGRLRGAFTRVGVVLAEGALTRGDLDRELGEGRELPRVGAGRPYVIAYHVEVAGAPFTCEVLAKTASWDDPPSAVSPLAEVNLRRDRAPR
ncbi:MAG TPA: hypothetical protein VN253_12835 [Kofleriaceae bacterium]|nr:hypothetical protein [Kofleriaceae bacterium]